MSHNLENNKILAAVLVAGIVAYLAGFASHLLVPGAHESEKSVLNIDTSALESAASGGDAAPTGPEPVLALLASADVKKGEALSKACLACHDFSKGGPNKIGPNLWGIVNNKKAHKEDFAYSDVIKAMAEKGDHWSYKNLNGFLWKPQVYAKGTKMTYPGLKKVEDRASVIAFLRTLADSPAPLPTPEEVAADAPATEKVAPAAPAGAPATPTAAPDTQAKDAPEAKAADPAQQQKENGAPDTKKPENSGGKSAEPTAPTAPGTGATQGNVKPADPAAHSGDAQTQPGATAE